MAVIDRNKRLVGLVALSDLATRTRRREQVGEIVEGILQPSQPAR
ncbi:MAG: CBS domain-containing protein [Deltaproteobacteria bacterium]|nr:MAG: CBS domain-containing protein [Deltaproteobacteria bacterium]